MTTQTYTIASSPDVLNRDLEMFPVINDGELDGEPVRVRAGATVEAIDRIGNRSLFRLVGERPLYCWGDMGDLVKFGSYVITCDALHRSIQLSARNERKAVEEAVRSFFPGSDTHVRRVGWTIEGPTEYAVFDMTTCSEVGTVQVQKEEV